MNHTHINTQPPQWWQIALIALAGAAAGVLLAFAGGYIGPWLVQNDNGWNDLIASVLGAMLGYVIGAPLGVLASARLVRQRGNLWTSWLGSLLGGGLIMLLAEPLRLNQQSWLLMTAFAATALLGALLGFRRSR